jgi:hypothetical protein
MPAIVVILLILVGMIQILFVPVIRKDIPQMEIPRLSIVLIEMFLAFQDGHQIMPLQIAEKLFYGKRIVHVMHHRIGIVCSGF